MKNIEKYKGIVLTNLNYCKMETDLRKMGAKAVIDCAHTYCENCKEHFFKWLLEECKEPILNEAEKNYLSAVIEPFRDKVKYISKQKNSDSSMEFIHIDLSDGDVADVADFPNFKANTMYKGMEVDKDYTLQELGL